MCVAVTQQQVRQMQTTNDTTIKEGIMGEFKSGFFMSESACNGRVLVVDDEPDIRKVVRMTLQKAGYEVIEAENGEKAIEAINTGENRLLLDVLICDIRMPKINGVEAIAYFQQEWPRVPIIVLTGFPDTDMATSFLRSGVVDYLVKPVDLTELALRIENIMKRYSSGSNHGTNTSSDTFHSGDISVDLRAKSVKKSSHQVELSPKEYELLAVLIKHRGMVLDRDFLYEAVW